MPVGGVKHLITRGFCEVSLVALQFFSLSFPSSRETGGLFEGGNSGWWIKSRWLVGIGLALVALGLLWPWLGPLGLGRLPGDIVIERGGFHFYFPIVTCFVVSVVASLILWLLNR
jgi:hypothetical protein